MERVCAPLADETGPVVVKGACLPADGGGACVLAVEGDSALENELSRQGADAYHRAYANYTFCAICDFEHGSLVVLSNKLWASQIIRLVRGVLDAATVEVRLPA